MAATVDTQLVQSLINLYQNFLADTYIKNGQLAEELINGPVDDGKKKRRKTLFWHVLNAGSYSHYFGRFVALVEETQGNGLTDSFVNLLRIPTLALRSTLPLRHC